MAAREKIVNENDDVPFQIGRLGAALTLTREKKQEDDRNIKKGTIRN